MADALVQVRNLSVVYPGSTEGHVLEGLSFAAGPAERLALIGANGAGKSTLLLTLAGVLPIHDGEIVINGRRVEKKNLPAVRRDAGLVFQNPDDQLFMSTLWEDVLFGPLNYLAAEKPARDAAAQRRGAIEAAGTRLLETLGIVHLKEKMPHKLSGGEKRLAALASVLIMEPAILLLDEPSAFLDPRARRRLIGILGGLSQTLIVATHDLEMARALCPRSLVLRKGRVHADGPTDHILSDGALLDECGL